MTRCILAHLNSAALLFKEMASTDAIYSCLSALRFKLHNLFVHLFSVPYLLSHFFDSLNFIPTCSNNVLIMSFSPVLTQSVQITLLCVEASSCGRSASKHLWKIASAGRSARSILWKILKYLPVEDQLKVSACGRSALKYLPMDGKSMASPYQDQD